MGILSAFLGSVGASSITATPSVASAVRLNSCSAGIEFTSSGQQIIRRNNNQRIQGLWVTPSFGAAEWEIRATLIPGSKTPLGDALNTWLPLTSSRSWALEEVAVGPAVESRLTFEFRRVGGSTPEVTVAGNIISVQVLDGFR